jgi:hypothetical protein
MAHWQLAQVSTSGRGNRIAAISSKDGATTVRIPKTTSPFGAGTFNQDPTATRLNLDLVIPDELLDTLREIDQFAVKALSADKKHYFSKDVDVQSVYKSCINEHVKGEKVYKPTIRCKINTTGSSAVRHWTPDRQLRDAPDDYRNVYIEAMAVARQIYFMAGSCGVVLDITDMIIHEHEAVQCPF